MLTYYLPECGEDIEDARELKQMYDWKKISDDPESFAEDVGEYIHYYRDGWERTYPIEIMVLKDGKEIGCYSIEREYYPSFSATKIEKKVDLNTLL